LSVASSLGADIAFFLYEDTFCSAKNIGDKITPIHAKNIGGYIVIAYPGFESSTKNVYAKFKPSCMKKTRAKSKVFNNFVSSLEKSKPTKWKKFLFNELETAVLPYDRKISTLHKHLHKLSDGAALMSGSGSSVFAILGNEKRAKLVAQHIKKKAKIVFSTCFLGRKTRL
jgi:4-diphosphocytidyl-2-C-methyl-D-erythritol kinase